MTKPKFVDYSGAAPILLPVAIQRYWRGFYLPADPDDELPDLELSEGAFNVCDDFDFANPKTDYVRACSLGGIPAVQAVSVGPGKGLVFATELDALTWWPEMQTLVNGGCLPELARLEKVEWSDELVWQTTDAEFLLMNACNHGNDLEKTDCFDVRLDCGNYVVQRGEYGWADNDPALVLFRFVLKVGG